MSQKSDILALLKRGYTITPDEAKRWFGCERLASRIWTLIHKDGYGIDAPLVNVGDGKHVSQYKLRSLPQAEQYESLLEMIWFPKEAT